MKIIDVVLGVEIEGTRVSFGLIDRFGNYVTEDKIPMKAHEEPEVLFERLFKKFKDMYSAISDKYKLVGIGIAAPTANYATGTIENSSNLNWKHVNVVDIVHQYWDVSVVITNDANAAALGEIQYGAAKNFKNFIQITLGTGLGSGIVVDGNIVYGNDGFAGEIGHTTVVHDGRHCGCGRQGCLETYVSTSGIIRTVSELLAQHNDDSVLREIPPNELTSKLIYKAAINGDMVANAAFEQTGKMLGEALANAVAYLSPEAIILSEGLALAGDLLIRPAKFHMEKNVLNLFKGKVQILVSGLTKGNVAILGASALIWHELQLSKNQLKIIHAQ